MKLLIIFLLFSNFIYANQKVTLQLSWLHQFQFAGYYIAKEKGFYKDVGIDVDIKEFQFGMNLSTVVENEKADFAIGRSSLLIDKANGKDVVALFSAFQNSPLILLVREDSNIKTLKDLKNKKVVITTDAKGSASILAMLSSKKIFPNDIIVQKHSFNLDDLINAKTDAMGSYISNEPIRLEDKGIKYKIFDPKDYDFNFYSDILFTSSSFIKNNSELTKAFYEATLKGWQYAFENIGKTALVIQTKYNSQNKSLVHLVAEGEALKKLAFTKTVDTVGSLEKNKLQKIVDIYKVMGLMNKDIDLDKFIYEYNKPNTFNMKLNKNEILIYILVGLILLILLIFISIYFSIKRKWLHTTEKLTTEIKKNQEKEKLLFQQSKMAAMGEMIENIAHQWRQPLSVISTAATGLKLKKKMNLLQTTDVETTMESINNSAQHLSQTIDDFRDFFRIGKQKDTFYIEETFDKAFKLITLQFETSNIIIVKSIKNVMIYGFEYELIQVLINIFNNARDELIKKEGSEKFIFINMVKNSDNIEIYIKDNAGGISKDAINKIFISCFTTKSDSDGTGIGLYMSKIIIEDNFKGTIKASNVDFIHENITYNGALFKITIPFFLNKKNNGDY